MKARSVRRDGRSQRNSREEELLSSIIERSREFNALYLHEVRVICKRAGDDVARI